MEIKQEVKKSAGKAAGKATDLFTQFRNSVETAWLSRTIGKELAEGTPLEDIILRRLPLLNREYIQMEAEALRSGIQYLRTNNVQAVNVEWVRQHLSDVLNEIDAGQRVTYLRNMIQAITTAYPNCILDVGAAAVLQRVDESAEAGTDEDVEDLLAILAPLYPQAGELLQRSSVKAMESFMTRKDIDMTAQKIDDGENAVLAYAASCYIMQKCGKFVKIDGQSSEDLPAYTIGISAAAAVESSRMMQMYCAGKIKLEELRDWMSTRFVQVLTYISESMIHWAAVGLEAAGAITFSAIYCFTAFELLDWLLIAFNPFLFVAVIAASAALGCVTMDHVANIEDLEDVIQSVWDMLKEVWAKVVAWWHQGEAEEALEESAETEAEVLVAGEAAEEEEAETAEEEIDEDDYEDA